MANESQQTNTYNNKWLYDSAEDYKNQQQYDMAERCYQLAVLYGDPQAYLSLASLYEQQKKYEEAINQYILLININGDSTSVLKLATLYETSKKYNEVWKMYLHYLTVVKNSEIYEINRLCNVLKEGGHNRVANKILRNFGHTRITQ